MQLHEQTQRFILLSIFYLFGPILTFGIIGGIVIRKNSANARHWERSFTQQTGEHWEIQSVEYRSPGFVRLHKVNLLDVTAEHPVFYAEQLDVRLIQETGREKIFPGIAVTPQTKATGLTHWLTNTFPILRSTDRYWQISSPFAIVNFGKYSSEQSAMLLQNLLRKICNHIDTSSDVPVHFVFDEIAVISEYSLKKEGDKAEDIIDQFRFVQGNIYRTPGEVRSDWSFQIKDISEIDREYLSFTLSDTLSITFRTGKQPVPCDLAAVFCTMFKHFSGGTFQGEFVLSNQIGTDARTVRFNQAYFRNIPLAPLVHSYTDFAVTGTIADLQLYQAEFGKGKTNAEGNLQVVDGAAAMTLVHRCVDKFQLNVLPATTLDLPTQMLPFSACVIHFRLQPEGIDFWADTKWRDAFMHYPGDSRFPAWTIYFPSQRRTVTYHELMSIFAPDSAPVVPLTQRTQSLLQHIPIK